MNSIWHRVVYQPNSFRKKIVAVCRAQYVPLPKPPPYTRLHIEIGMDHPSSQSLDPDGKDVFHFLVLYKHLLTDPSLCSLILNILYAAPYLDEQKNKEIKESWGKEIRTLETQALPSYFNYNVWFDPSCFSQPFCPDIPANPEMASYIHMLLWRWREACCNKIHYPRASNKTMAHNTIRKVSEFLGLPKWDESSQGLFTQKSLMEIQHQYKRRFDGPTEIRQKWYRSKVSPRTYFAQGGTAWNASKHCQGVFNDLVDQLISTNYLYRLSPTRIRIDNDEALKIWDLTSFTSNHHESRHFLLRLSSFCSGYKIKLMDEVDGFIEVDFGNLLGVYAQQNCFPEYTLERCDEFYVDLISFHHVAGFLGVYGNLPSSTFLHGASCLQVVGDPNKINCAGDDGHAASVPGTYKDYTLDRVIRRNGLLEESKMYWTYEEGSICLKRGIVQIGSFLLQKEMILWPSISLILECIFGEKAPSHNRNPTKRSKIDIQSAVATEMFRFMNSLFLHNQQFGLHLDYAAQFCRNVWTNCGLPVCGSVPQLGGQYLCPIMPRDESAFQHSPLNQLISYHYSGRVELPLRGSTSSFEVTEFLNIAGWQFTCNTSSYYGFLETLGYLESVPIKRTYFDIDGFDRLIKEFSSPGPSVVEYSVLRVVPDQFLIQ